MTYYLAHIVLSLISSIGFGIIFNAPRKALPHCGLVGMGGWMMYLWMTDSGIDIVQAAFCGAFVVGLIGHILAKYYKTPIITFIVAGIIPLVPGGTAYDAMRHVVGNDYAQAIPLATKAFVVASAIAMGLVFAEVLVQFFLKMGKKRKLRNS
ncbi:threonine/serine exporter family protein [Lederbergia sp. NSJ-179]|uniref:threonine/serine exporter family protein n=1 Tax=Lederbergia sp. NSJ-179 TaxID=2931402 RepID=UPI001FD039AE|nr:threonine/serine exporter family protein [Lederbergia sp. NSJ-179]MCJ7841103.1 threonine/serine exporter family protein [Lederbergia sp. NSJ-179]